MSVKWFNQWFTPYSIKTSSTYLFFKRIQILFEEESIYEVFCGITKYKESRKDLENICAMLNGAYNLGLHKGKLMASVDIIDSTIASLKKDEKKKKKK